MRCAHCGAHFDLGDNFCRRCGISLNHRNLPTVVSRSPLPVPWEAARGTVVRGVAALLVGTLVELVRREVSRRASPPDPSRALALLAEQTPPEARRGRFPWSRAPRGEYQVTETLFQRQMRYKR